MPNIIGKTCSVIFFMLFFSTLTNAQPRKGEFIQGSLGLGLSAPYEDVDLYGSGFYTQVEYVLALKKWFGVRPYAGFIYTTPNTYEVREDLSQYRVSSKAALLGGKIRVAAPIPWVAPYIECGLGVSIGSFETYTPNINIKKSGLQAHIPFSLGLAIGRKHNFDVAFTYYFQPALEQVAGAAAVGFSLPLN